MSFIQLVFRGLEAAYLYKNNSDFQFSCIYLCLNAFFAPCGLLCKPQFTFSCHVEALINHVNQYLISFRHGAVYTQVYIERNPEHKVVSTESSDIRWQG